MPLMERVGVPSGVPPPLTLLSLPSQADKRAHHNALERKRRDHIKDSFHSLRDSVPSLQGEKASRAQILDKATEYIQYMRRKNHTHQQDIDDLKRQNALLEQQGE
nr:protein max [Columba livia]